MEENNKSKTPVPDDLTIYTRHYNEQDFCDKIRKAASKAGAKGIYLALTLYYSLDKASITDKLMIFGALGYFILPTDLIPDIVIGLGYTDDIAAMLIVYNRLKSNIDEHVEEKVRKETLRWFPSVDPKELKL